MRPVAGTSFLFSERTLEEQLAEGERVLVQTKRHPVVLWKPVGRALLALILWAWYVFEVPNPGKILDVLSVVVLALAAWVVWCEWERRHNRFIITDQRLLLYEGIITRKVPMMRLSKVTDVTYFRSVPGRILGYGTIIIESAGQDQAMHNLTYLPEPDSVYAELNGALFGRKAKEKAVAGNRRGMRRRRRGDGSGGDPGGPDTAGGSGPISGPGGSGGPGPSGGSGDSGDSGGYGGSGSPDGTGGGFLLPFDDEPAYDIDSTDVPPAGYPSSGARPAYEDTGTIYSSSRRRAAEDDTGPIPIKDWPRRTR